MKIKNESKFILIIGNSSINPNQILDVPESMKKDPSLEEFISKGYIRILSKKDLNSIKKPSEVKYVLGEQDSQKVKKGNIEYVVSGSAEKLGDNVDNVDGGIGTEDDEVAKILQKEIEGEELFDVDDNNIADGEEKIMKSAIDAEQDISEDLARTIKSNGDFGGEDVPVDHLLKENLKKAKKDINESLNVTAVPKEIKNFEKQPMHKKRLEISKSTDENFLNTIASSSSNEVIKKLALNRIKEIKK